jgi:hypothetical protein
MKTTLLMAAVALTGTLVGCGGGGVGGADRPETAPVSVTVTYNSSPVADATVTFSPKDAKAGTAAYGKTNSSGTVKLNAFPDAQGVVPGDYKVLVTKVEVPKSQALSMDDPNYDGEATEPVDTTPKHLVPEKYSVANTSTLDATVEAGKDNSFEFNLED